MHPQSGAIIVRAAMPHFENGKVSKRFADLAQGSLRRYDKAFKKLAE